MSSRVVTGKVTGWVDAEEMVASPKSILAKTDGTRSDSKNDSEGFVVNPTWIEVRDWVDRNLVYEKFLFAATCVEDGIPDCPKEVSKEASKFAEAAIHWARHMIMDLCSSGAKGVSKDKEPENNKVAIWTIDKVVETINKQGRE